MDAVQVDDRTVAKAYINFLEIFYPEINKSIKDPGMGMYFWKFLGMEVSPEVVNPNWLLPRNAAYRCKLLAGPHYKAIAKLLTLKGHQYNVKVKHRTIEWDRR